jgi:4-hydroxybenzoate polyprenyltransferase
VIIVKQTSEDEAALCTDYSDSVQRDSGTSALGYSWIGSLACYLAIARPHHYGKNVLLIVGATLATLTARTVPSVRVIATLGIGLIATCLIASSNYVMNEVLDAGNDRHHPDKRNRPFASGRASPAIAMAEWFGLGALGLLLAAWIGTQFVLVAAAFQLLAICYNVPPLRLKDIPYLDVLTEAANSPLRLLLGWFIVLPSTPPGVWLILAFWMAGAFEMTRKRLKEYRRICDRAAAGAYRRSFIHYNEERLRWSMVVFASMMLLCSIFAIRDLAEEYRNPQHVPGAHPALPPSEQSRVKTIACEAVAHTGSLTHRNRPEPVGQAKHPNVDSAATARQRGLRLRCV